MDQPVFIMYSPGKPGGVGLVGGERVSVFGGITLPGFLLGVEMSWDPWSGCVPGVAPVPHRERVIAASPPSPLPTASSFGFYPSSSFSCPSAIFLRFKNTAQNL